MDPLALLIAAALAAFTLKTIDQRRRIALLGTHLQHFSLEKQMETLSDGYLRALGTDDPERRAQVWALMARTEHALSDQLTRLAREMAGLDPDAVQVSKLPIAFPYADRVLPGTTFDLRAALDIHARGIACAIADDPARDARAKAFTVLAEMYLFQHTCHWFCRSKAVASARLMARHKTAYAQVLAAVTPDTRRAYRALVGA